MTVPHIVENAIAYGVRKRPDGRGTVTVRTREYPDRFEIAVLDDGPGFSPESEGDDSRTHTGIPSGPVRLFAYSRREEASCPEAGVTKIHKKSLVFLCYMGYN